MCNFFEGYDAVWSDATQDFSLTRVGTANDNSQQKWGLLVNFQYVNTTAVPSISGGCQFQPAPGSEILWAFDAASKRVFLDVQPRTAVLKVGETKTFTVTNGRTGLPVQGADLDNIISDANGKIVYTAGRTGNFRLKAQVFDSVTLKSPTVFINVS